ncbi:hypothetical protein CR513_19366, partial [Mucuna pruriens]
MAMNNIQFQENVSATIHDLQTQIGQLTTTVNQPQSKGIEVDKAKIDIISSLSHLASMWEEVHLKFQHSSLAIVQAFTVGYGLDDIIPWFADIVNYLVPSILPLEASRSHKDKIKCDVKYCMCDDPYLLKFCSDKVLDSRFYWPTIFKEAHHIITTCEQYQRAGGVDFLGPFPTSYGYAYNSLVVDYVSKWMEGKATKINDTKVVADFVRSNVFEGLGSHFCNKTMSILLENMGWYIEWLPLIIPKPMGRLREIKQILQKVDHPNRNDWSRLLEDTFWAHKTTYRTMLGMSSYHIVFGKACHLSIEIEHCAYWLQLQEVEELLLETYENSKIYKEKVKHFHDNMILRKEFKGQKMLLFNSRLKLIDGPFVITNVFPYSTIEIRDEITSKIFKVNGYQLKSFHDSPTIMEGDVEDLSLVKPTILEGAKIFLHWKLLQVKGGNFKKGKSFKKYLACFNRVTVQIND